MEISFTTYQFKLMYLSGFRNLSMRNCVWGKTSGAVFGEIFATNRTAPAFWQIVPANSCSVPATCRITSVAFGYASAILGYALATSDSASAFCRIMPVFSVYASVTCRKAPTTSVYTSAFSTYTSAISNYASAKRAIKPKISIKSAIVEAGSQPVEVKFSIKSNFKV